VFWSGGKDCATALHEVITSERYRGCFRVSGLLTTLTEDYDRISGHGVRSSILELQAACVDISLRKTYITKPAAHSRTPVFLHELAEIIGMDDVCFFSGGGQKA